MPLRLTIPPPLRRVLPLLPQQHHHRRTLTVLAIETSCDDTSVALLSSPTPTSATLLAHKTVTSPNRIYGGIHPLVSTVSHATNLAPLLHALKAQDLPAPDFIAVTRGPGMPTSLSIGLDTAKGLAVAYGVPLVGVHHMLAHTLTPRLVAALNTAAVERGKEGEQEEDEESLERGQQEQTLEIATPEKKTQITQRAVAEAPGFPFLTLLVSGGHTQVVHSRGLTSHSVLADTTDIAVGDMLDKAARTLVPPAVLAAHGDSVAYGAALEDFCFPAREGSERRWGYKYLIAGGKARAEEDRAEAEQWDWQLSAPLAKTPTDRKRMAYSFSGLGSSVDRCVKRKARTHGKMEDGERRGLGRKVMVLAFEHVAERMVLGLENMYAEEREKVDTLVVSGGVAANQFFRHILRIYLTSKGYQHVKIVVPPTKYCTDNAAMIAWAGLELYRAGWQTALAALPLKKWSMDDAVCALDGDQGKSQHGAGGILGAQHWVRSDDVVVGVEEK